MKKIIMILVAMFIVFGSFAIAKAEVDGFNCLAVEPSVYKKCIDGYEYVMVKQGCFVVGFTQTFEIYPKKSGKPKMMLPVPCDSIDLIHIP